MVLGASAATFTFLAATEGEQTAEVEVEAEELVVVGLAGSLVELESEVYQVGFATEVVTMVGMTVEVTVMAEAEWMDVLWTIEVL